MNGGLKVQSWMGCLVRRYSVVNRSLHCVSLGTPTTVLPMVHPLLQCSYCISHPIGGKIGIGRCKASRGLSLSTNAAAPILFPSPNGSDPVAFLLVQTPPGREVIIFVSW